MPKAPALSIVIVSWNVWPHLRSCLEALPAAAGDVRYEVIVVDNASTDGTPERVRAAFPQVRLVENGENRLYTAAANQGLAMARGAMLMLLNPDVVPHPQSIERLVLAARENPRAGLLGPRILDGEGREDWRTGRELPSPWSEFVDWSGLGHWLPWPWLLRNRRPGCSRAQTGPVPLLSGACLLFSAHLPPHLRKLDPRYPMYGEDIDLCRRVQEAGWACVLVGGAVMTHKGGASSAQRPAWAAAMAVTSMQRYFRQWEGPAAAVAHWILIMMVALGKTLLFCGGAWRRPEWRGSCAIYRAVARALL